MNSDGSSAEAAQAPAACDWTDGARPYPYPFRGRANNLPDCRQGRAGTQDLGRDAWIQRGRRLNMRRSLDFLEGNPDENGREYWPLVDSLGRRLAILERHSNRWDLHDPDTGRTIYSDSSRDSDQLLVQGRGGMRTEALMRAHALIAFRANDRRRLPRGASIVPFQLRAFISRRALPPRNRRGQAIRSAVGRYDVGTGGSTLRPAGSDRLRDPGFAAVDRFVGEDGLRRTYATYNAKAPFGGAIYLLVNTPGVHGGGIVRGVVRVGDSFERADGFDYCDPNVPSGSPAIARWSYGRLSGTRLWGWIPARC
jgi:hypothetical protein